MRTSGIGLPNISVVFKEAAASAGIRLQAAKVAVIIVQEGISEGYVREQKTRITTSIVENSLSQDSVDFINRTFDGCYGRKPSVVYVSVADSAQTALDRLKNYDFDWLCGYRPEKVASVLGIDEQLPTEDINSLIARKTEEFRLNGKYCKAVVTGESAPDKEYIVHFAAGGINSGNKIYSAEQYTSRIAGILASLPLSQSCTYFMLPEVDSVDAVPDAEQAVDMGKLVLINDGEVVRIARGVTSATSEGERKIKVQCAKDKISREIKQSIKDGFVGKMANTYDNKCILITAIKNYLDTLIKLGVLSGAEVGIDIDEQENWLAQNGADVSTMTVQEIKEADTGDNVFIAISCTLTDAMENFLINITI